MKFQISGYKNVSLQLNKPLGSHVEPGRLVIPRLEAGALDMGTGRAGTRVSRLELRSVYAWMEFRDRSTHAVREREVLYRLIVR